MKKRIAITGLIFSFFIAAPLFASKLEISVGPSFCLDISSYEMTYDWKLSATALYRLNYPLLIGLQYGYMAGYQELLFKGVIRILPQSWKIKADVSIMGGLVNYLSQGFNSIAVGMSFDINYYWDRAYFGIHATVIDTELPSSDGDRPYTSLSVGPVIGFYF